MTRAGWARARRVVATAPVPALGGSVCLSVALLGVAVWTAGTSLGVVPAILGLGVCTSGAADVFDEEPGEVLDATPTGRSRRMSWRLSLVLVPMAVSAVGVWRLDVRDPAAHWPRMCLVALGLIAFCLAGASVSRSRGSATPGDRWGIAALAAAVVVAIDPARTWAPLLPLGLPSAGRSTVVWATVTAVCGVVLVWGMRDPGAGRSGRPGGGAGDGAGDGVTPVVKERSRS